MERYLCNPMNLEYRFQLKKTPEGEKVFREAADPTMLLFKGTYYLFASVSGGFWYSEDLYDWKFKETPELPVYDYAPDVREINGKVVFSASKSHEPCTFFISPNPLSEPFTALSSPFPFWDPALFQDDDGRVYFYWGCGNKDPLWGMELDPETLMPASEKVTLFGEQEYLHGWERNGENNCPPPPKDEAEKLNREKFGYKPYIEGAYMNKYKGKYYLQYAAPGTEVNVYGDGVYVSETPLGPFVYQAHNPFSIKPGGFITAAGHGSSFQDKFGNFWHISTMRISENDIFERRLGLFPCNFDADGLMYCNQHFADYPFALPDGLRKDMNRAAPAWNLLSYKKPADASSFQPGFEAEKGTDENIKTWWAAEKGDSDAWYQIDLGKSCYVNAVQINFAEHQVPMPDEYKENKNHRIILINPKRTCYTLEGSADGENWDILKEGKGDFTHDFVYFLDVKELRYIRVSQIKTALNGVPAISGLRIFGKGMGEAPAAAENVTAIRTPEGLDVLLRWNPVSNADGYNIRFGIASDKLYGSWQVFGKNELTLSLLNKGVEYYIAVDSFNENGVTAGPVFFIV